MWDGHARLQSADRQRYRRGLTDVRCLFADLPIFVVLRNAYPGLWEGKGFIYRLYRDSSPKRSGMDHTVLPANYTIPASIS